MEMFGLLILQLAVLACSASELGRIVGGEPTSIEKYPIIVQVEFLVDSSIWTQNCAGSVLTSRTILSAAHCYVGPSYSPRERRIRAGSSYRYTGGTIKNVALSLNHPTFGLNDYDGDIALLFLEDRLVYSNVIAQAAIASSTFVVPDNSSVTHIGWGMVSLPGNRSEVLREVDVLSVNNDLCRERYKTANPPRVVTPNMICAGILDVGGKGACFGDSGGPLLYSDVVVGIVAFGEGCADATAPGVNTLVSPYTNWIVENAN
ncbi:unnamed protein product, partial [Iphiclides podalirius]